MERMKIKGAIQQDDKCEWWILRNVSQPLEPSCDIDKGQNGFDNLQNDLTIVF